jgi:hypothetical protein
VCLERKSDQRLERVLQRPTLGNKSSRSVAVASISLVETITNDTVGVGILKTVRSRSARYTFTTAASLVGGKKPYVCAYPRCGKGFARPEPLATHIHNDHVGEDPTTLRVVLVSRQGPKFILAIRQTTRGKGIFVRCAVLISCCRVGGYRHCLVDTFDDSTVRRLQTFGSICCTGLRSEL